MDYFEEGIKNFKIKADRYENTSFDCAPQLVGALMSELNAKKLKNDINEKEKYFRFSQEFS